jgi:hypothetical protein
VVIEQNAVKTRGSTVYTRIDPRLANIGTKYATTGQYQGPTPLLLRQGHRYPLDRRLSGSQPIMWGRGIHL